MNSIFDWIARKNKVIEVKLSIKTRQEQARPETRVFLNKITRRRASLRASLHCRYWR